MQLKIFAALRSRCVFGAVPILTLSLPALFPIFTISSAGFQHSTSNSHTEASASPATPPISFFSFLFSG